MSGTHVIPTDPGWPYVGIDQSACHQCEFGTNPADCQLKDITQIAVKELESTYFSSMNVGCCEAADSLVVRSELFFAGQTAFRTLRRKHVFEEAAEQRRYCGAIDLRVPPTEGIKPIASAWLKAPLHMIRDRSYALPLLWYYSIYAGLKPFLCLPYTLHDRCRGHFCAQGAMYVALTVLARYGAKMFGPATITALAHAPSARPEDIETQSGMFEVSGLTFDQMITVAEGANAGALLESVNLSATKRPGRALFVFLKMIEAYLSSGFAIILGLHVAPFYDGQQELLERLGFPQGRHFEPRAEQARRGNHAVVVVGGRNLESCDPKVISLVFLDTLTAPFVEKTLIRTFCAAALAFLSGSESSRPRFLVAVPDSVKVRVSDCLFSLRKGGESFRPGWWWWRARLLEGTRLPHTLFSRTRQASADCEDGRPSARKHIESVVRNYKLVWSIEMFADQTAYQKREPRIMWLFDAAAYSREVGGNLVALPFARIGWNSTAARLTIWTSDPQANFLNWLTPVTWDFPGEGLLLL